MMTDEHGRLVVPVQAVRPGLSTYYFYEFGPVLGMRIASNSRDAVIRVITIWGNYSLQGVTNRLPGRFVFVNLLFCFNKKHS